MEWSGISGKLTYSGRPLNRGHFTSCRTIDISNIFKKWANAIAHMPILGVDERYKVRPAFQTCHESKHLKRAGVGKGHSFLSIVSMQSSPDEWCKINVAQVCTEQELFQAF